MFGRTEGIGLGDGGGGRGFGVDRLEQPKCITVLHYKLVLFGLSLSCASRLDLKAVNGRS